MWFNECDSALPGMGLRMKIERVLYHRPSKYQDILMFKSESNGNVLVLDNRIQTTEFDECSYQEMMALLPLSCHPNPERVLIVGGGDGAILRHVIKDNAVKKAVLCEIDGDVVDVCKKYFPEISSALNTEQFPGKEVEVKICDGNEFVEQCAKGDTKFDVIITDSSDPDGPAKSLFGEEYYAKLKNALRPPNGIFCSQGECMWMHAPFIKRVLNQCRKHFPVVAYSSTSVPTYPAGCIGFFLGSLNEHLNLRKPTRDLSNLEGLKYYTKEVHQASFALPKFIEDELKDIVKQME